VWSCQLLSAAPSHSWIDPPRTKPNQEATTATTLLPLLLVVVVVVVVQQLFLEEGVERTRH
jgi:hypothetical protein